MAPDYLHNHKEFPELLRIVENDTGVLAGLVEKDYWIMHVLYGLKKMGLQFELKGGTSLSKGYKIIRRFSEDIDIHIKPAPGFKVDDNPDNNSKTNVQARKNFYDQLAKSIGINGIVSVDRDTDFDDLRYYRSGGIRLHYTSYTSAIEGVKEGILLETGFDTVTPNTKLTINSWAFEKAKENTSLEIKDNQATEIACYDHRYTFVEKLQTIVRKFRRERESKKEGPNYMRQYYDVYCLLGNEEVQKFIGTDEYVIHKKARFSSKDLEIPIARNEAFLLSSAEVRDAFTKRYEKTKELYYKGQPQFEELLARIQAVVNKL